MTLTIDIHFVAPGIDTDDDFDVLEYVRTIVNDQDLLSEYVQISFSE